MGRHKTYTDEQRLRTLLQAVHAHPWARLRDLMAFCRDSRHGLSDIALPLAARAEALEFAPLAGPARREQRFALTIPGAARLGVPYDRARLQDALLRAHHLDAARALLAQWAPQLVWSVSPFTVRAGDVRPPTSRKPDRARPPTPREPGPGPYRSLRLDALACVQINPGNYAHLALQVDPGGLDLDWFYQQFRSAHAWGWRPQFRETGRLRFPVFVVVAATPSRLAALRDAWRDAAAVANRGEMARQVRLITWTQLGLPDGERHWVGDSYGPVSAPWAHSVPFSPASRPPGREGWPWCGGAGAGSLTAPRRPRGSFLSGFRPTQKRDKRAMLLYRHYQLSWRGRLLLGHIGQYPLITGRELALVLDRTPKAVRGGLQELLALELIAHPAAAEPGYALTAHGLALLAAQAGMRPAEFARQRHWPTHKAGPAVVYSVQGLLACRSHSRLVLDFLVGLRRHGPRAQHALTAWEHVDCLHEYPFASETGAPPRDPAPPKPGSPLPPTIVRIVPDATGVVRVFGDGPTHYADTTFWLEVDRGTERGRAVLDKLSRYYRHAHRQWPWDRHMPRLLIVVEHQAEARLNYLRERLRWLNQQYQMELDVRLTRADLLATRGGGLDPTRPKWRTLDDDRFGLAFDQPPAPGSEPPC